jgi:hypothetical protein
MWFQAVGPDEQLSQGDIIESCPVLTWAALDIGNTTTADLSKIKAAADAVQIDAIIMTQACDMQHRKIEFVVICPCYLLTGVRESWEKGMKARKQEITARAWERYCGDITEGHVWNQFMLEHSEIVGIEREHRVVDFGEIYTIPRDFLDKLVSGRTASRLRLLSPYREHLSQSFARFFMRVGLPVNVTKAWGQLPSKAAN